MQSSSDIYDLAIIGAGIVGLATAHFLHQSAPDRKIVVIDKESGPGLHQTGHNSGVIHAGIYYAPGSLKAKLCTAGAKATNDFCDTARAHPSAAGAIVVMSVTPPAAPSSSGTQSGAGANVTAGVRARGKRAATQVRARR